MKNIYTIALVAASITGSIAQNCKGTSSQTQLGINNVNATISNGGNLWLKDNLVGGKPGYEIPKGSGKHSVFSGGIWIGGLDASNQLHLAAQTYRQGANGGGMANDFFAGPMDTINCKADSLASCAAYDQVFKITRLAVKNFIDSLGISGYVIPQELINWPGNGDVSKLHAKKLAPFFDKNADGIYNPADGDYPHFDFSGNQNCNSDILLGDEVAYTIFNDVGNTHTETGGLPMGVEIHQQTYAYTSPQGKYNEALENTTFYKFKVINRCTTKYTDTYFGLHLDADLGQFDDDFIGSDVGRSMGYCYNSDNVDGTGTGLTYGVNPPAVGFDLLSGPEISDAVVDGKDSYGTSFVDGNGRIKLSHIVYYNNDFTLEGNPSLPQHYYNYLKGLWKDGSPQTYGDTGNMVSNFVFPGNTDPNGLGTGMNMQTPWSEVTSGNTPGDRRLVLSCGPFTFNPGETKTITMAVVWARGSDNLNSVVKLQEASDKVQNMYDGCFSPSLLASATPVIKAESKISVTAYPMPSDNIVTLKINSKEKQTYSLTLIDITGKTIRNINNSIESEIQIQKGDLHSGIYFYSLNFADGTNKAGKIIFK